MTMTKIFLVIGNTFQKELRSKTLIFLFMMTIGVILVFNTLLNFLGEQVLSDVGLGQAGSLAISAITLLVGMWCYFLCNFLIIDTIRSDLERGVTSLLMTLPFNRLEYLLGRIFGVWSIVGLFYLFISIVAFWMFSSTANITFSLTLVYAFALNLLSYLAIIVFGLLIALFFGKLMSLAISMGITFFIHSSNTYFFNNPVTNPFSDFEFLRFFGTIFHYVFPRIGTVGTMAKSMIFNTALEINYLAEFAHYFLSLIFLLLVVRMIFRKKNL